MPARRRQRRRRRRKTTKRRVSQRGGAAFRRKKPRTIDKIAEGVSMFLAGPAPSFATAGMKLASQAAKGIKDNVDYFRRRSRR